MLVDDFYRDALRSITRHAMALGQRRGQGRRLYSHRLGLNVRLGASGHL